VAVGREDLKEGEVAGSMSQVTAALEWQPLSGDLRTLGNRCTTRLAHADVTLSVGSAAHLFVLPLHFHFNFHPARMLKEP